MRYVGGKSRIAKDLVPIILESRPKIVVEPFCGALNVTVALLKADDSLILHANDIHTELIDMWRAVRDGWDPPEHLTKEEYNALREGEPCPLRTFAGYGCSFSGKLWGGFAADTTGRNYCANARNSVLKIRSYLNRIEFTNLTYEEMLVPIGAVVYCDPPYAGTTKPGTRNDFDHSVFWEWVREQPNQVFVSEYTAPSDMWCVWSKHVKTDMNTKGGKDARVECLFTNW